VTTKSRDQLPLDLGGGDGLAELVPGGQLREMTAAERVEAELEILGIDLSRHVMSFYEGLMAELGVVYSADLQRCSAGDRVLVAGVKVATQTPAIRSGQRIIFATLDDATGPVDLAFFESVQERCAARVFASWLLAVRGRVRRAGRSVSVNAAECWDLPALAGIHAASGIGAVRAAMAAGDVPGAPPSSEPAPGGPPRIMYPNGFTLSPYAETGAPGGGMKDPPRLMWHASPGGGWAGGDLQSLVTFWIIVTIAISPWNFPAPPARHGGPDGQRHGWASSSALAMGRLGSGPHATGQSTGVIDVFWRGINHAVAWHATFTWAHGWCGPMRVADGLAGPPFLVASSADTESALWEGASGLLLYVDRVGGDVFAAGQSSGIIDAFRTGPAGGGLWHTGTCPAAPPGRSRQSRRHPVDNQNRGRTARGVQRFGAVAAHIGCAMPPATITWPRYPPEAARIPRPGLPYCRPVRMTCRSPVTQGFL
jgi:hypothetical protein